MQILAFDIESTDGLFKDGNLCEFGYTLADESFNIIDRGEILIRPVNKIKKINARIKLSFSYDEYFKAEKFCAHYDKIRELLTAEDTIVLGHAINNDIVCINYACVKISKPFCDFKFIDSQMIFGIFKNDNHASGLDKVAEEFGLNFTHHRAEDDSYVSLQCVKNICEALGKTFAELLNDYKIEVGTNKCGNIINTHSPLYFACAPSIESNRSKRRLINNFLDNVQPTERICENSLLYKKKVAIDTKLEMEDVTRTRCLIQRVYDLGAKYISQPNYADIYVTNDYENSKEIKGKVTNLSEFINHIDKVPELSFDDMEILKRYHIDKRIRNTNRLNKKYKKGK